MKFLKLFLPVFFFLAALIFLSPKAFAATVPLSIDTSTLGQAKFSWSPNVTMGLYIWRAADLTNACQEPNNTYKHDNSANPGITFDLPVDNYMARLGVYTAWASNCVSFSISEPPQPPGAGGLVGIFDALVSGGKIPKEGGIGALISGIYPIILGIAGFILVIFIIISGLQIVFSAGDPKALASARQRLIFAVVGFVVILGAFVITVVIQKILGINIL